MIDVVLHNLIHCFPYSVILLLQVLQFLLEVDIVLGSLGLLLVPHCGGGGSCCSGGAGCRSGLLTRLGRPLREGLVPVLANHLSGVISNQSEVDFEFAYSGDVVKVVIARNQSVLQVKLAPSFERSLKLLLKL